MKLPGLEINIELEKLSRVMPIAVAVICALILVVTSILELTIMYSLFFMLIIGVAASSILYFSAKDSQENVIPLSVADETVFDDFDVNEKLLSELESIVVLVNEISSKQIEESRIQTEDAVTALINRFMRILEEINDFSKINDTSKERKTDNVDLDVIRQGLSDIMVSFQFQDRTSQILQHVSNSLEMFSDEINIVQELRNKGGQPDYDKDEILKKISAGFTTAEQKAIASQNTNAVQNNRSAAVEADNVELF